MTDSLRDEFDGLGDAEFKDTIVELYGDKLKNQVLMGEELDVVDIGSSVRKYNHGQADSSEVVEYGVTIVFDAMEVELSELQEGGDIHMEIESYATKLISVPVEYIEVSFVTDEEYELWVVLDTDSF